MRNCRANLSLMMSSVGMRPRMMRSWLSKSYFTTAAKSSSISNSPSSSSSSPSLTADQGDVLCVEIPEGRWGRGQDFTQSLDTLLEQLVDAGIVSEHCPLLDATQIWIPRVYPVYHRGWFAQWKKALDDLGDLGEILPIDIVPSIQR